MTAPTVPAARGHRHSFAIAFGALALGALAMGVSPVFVRHAEIGPFASAFWRVAIALPALAAWAALEARNGGGTLRIAFPPAVLWTGLFFAADLTFWHLAILNTTMANATLMSCLAPVWVLFLSGVIIGEPVERKSFLGLAVCLPGAACLIDSSFQIAPDRLIGDFYGLVTSLFFGLYFLAVRTARRTMKGGQLLLSSTIVTAALLLVVAIASGDAMLPERPTAYASLGALALVSHVGGQGLLTLALGTLSAAFSSLVIFIEAVAAAIFGWLLFNEAMGLAEFAGAFLILAGIWIARPSGRARAKS